MLFTVATVLHLKTLIKQQDYSVLRLFTTQQNIKTRINKPKVYL